MSSRLDYAVKCECCGRIYSPSSFESLDYLRCERGEGKAYGVATFACWCGNEVSVAVRAVPPVRFLSYGERGKIHEQEVEEA